MTLSPTLSPRRKRIRRVTGVSLAVAATVLLSGCYSITDQTLAQLDVTGDVHVTTDTCLAGQSNASEDGCTAAADDRVYASQLFYAFELPDGVTAPETISATGSLAGVTFTRSAEFATAVAESRSVAVDDDSVEAPRHYVAYKSSTLPREVDITAARKAQLTADFGTAQLEATDFRVHTFAGYRWVREANGEDAAWTSDRPVVCGNPVPDYDVYTDATECQYSSEETSVGVNLLEVEAPEAAAVAAGDRPELKFQATSAVPAVPEPEENPEAQRTTQADGEGAAISVPVSVTTDIPGATVTAPDHYVLGESAELAASIAVPAGTPSGTYKATLTAGSGTGARSAAGTISVTGLPAAAIIPPSDQPQESTPPAVNIPVELAASASAFAKVLATPQSGQTLRSGGITVPLAFPVRGFVRVSLLGKSTKKGKKGPVLAVGTAQSSAGQLVNVKLKRTKIGKKLLAKSKTIDGFLVVRLWGREGKTVTTPVTLTLK